MAPDDFFSSVPVRPDADADVDAHDDFAHAIAVRFGSADLRTARLLPGDRPHHPPQPPAPPHAFAPVPPSALTPFLDDPRALVLDVRPHAAHAAARIHNAISLSVPTTLLKRPLFSLSKLALMLPSPSSRARFADWSAASRILVYDSDSLASPDNGVIAGLLRKFRAEGFTGELAWVRGGFQAVWNEARHLATTDRPLLEDDDPDPTSSTGTLRASYLPKAAFSLSSTTAAHPHHPFRPSYPLPNTPAPSASRAANPFFDTIRQNTELSHGITERIPLRLPGRVRRRIHDLPFSWLRDIAHRSALRHPHRPGFKPFESGSESSDDPHTSDPDENDPSVEEGAEALAMQFYRIELAEQRRLRSIMEHHTRESEHPTLAYPTRPRRSPSRGASNVSISPVQSGVHIRAGVKSVPGTPHPPSFPFSITAGVEKGTKNRYTHIWPFEHARVRLHDGRHQGSHPGRRDRSKVSERGRDNTSEMQDRDLDHDRHRRSRSSPAYGKHVDQDMSVCSPRHFYSAAPSSITENDVGREAGPAYPWGFAVPQVKIDFDATEQDSRVSGPSTPATALPFPSPPFYTPMDISPVLTPMRGWPPQSIAFPCSTSVSPGARAQLALPSPSFPLRLPSRPGGLLPSIGEQTYLPESPSSAIPLGGHHSRPGEAEMDTGTKRDLRREPSPADDYVNASYVQPLGTRKRYIATQGPLPSTYVDFWTLVWEQNVHVIVMLTREVENAMVKCGSYWTDAEFGPLRLELLSTSPPTSPSIDTMSMDTSKQGFFTIREPRGKTGSTSRAQSALITRVFLLSHTSYPGVPPRRVTHLQYLDWSDMNVPDDPRGILDLVKKLEHVVAESTPSPSPTGSLSPGSASGSLSGSQSPTGPDQNGYGTSSLSPTSAGVVPGGRRRHGSEWRHPELDPKTGIATFALGKAAPVLLHCSAGVGRTGGFIAVDAILDGIRRELRGTREEQCLKTMSGTSAAVGTWGKTDADGVEVSGVLSFESTEAGAKSAESSGTESTSDESERMDVDGRVVDDAESKTEGALHMVNTVPIHVSAGDHTKGRRRHHHSPSDKIRSSSESLVVHVPYVGTDHVLEETNVTGIDFGGPNKAGWQSSSTREWAEQVSDQTHAHAREGERLPPPSFSPMSRERSPGSTSTSSGPSALNSVDDSTYGSVSANASGSASASASANNMERKSGTSSASGSGHPPSSSVSKLGSSSISLSTSGSGSGTGSRLGSSLLRARLRESSVTSISVDSTDSLSSRPKLGSPLHRPSVVHTSTNSDMENDRPLRPVFAPLRPADSNTATPQRANRSLTMLGLSPITRLASPTLSPKPAGPFDGGEGDGAASQPSSEPGSPPECTSRESADAEGSGKNNQVSSDESETLAIKSKPRSDLQLNTKFGSLRIPGTLHSAESPLLPARESQGCKEAAMPRILNDSVPQQCFPAPEHDQRNVDYPVIDYKLPRQLHSDLSPPLISSFGEPICTVIQDMREQRMSLCQSLRQYVFVHAAIIEGALRIVDEEREIWGSVNTSDDASSGEGELGTSIGGNGKQPGCSEGLKAWSGRPDEAEVAVMAGLAPDDHRNVSRLVRPLRIFPQALNHPSSEPEIGGIQVPPAPVSSSSSMSSPSKGKRGPSPTELPREDKTGALSLNKRPSIHRQITHDQGNQLAIGSSTSPVAGENGDGSRDAILDVCAIRPAPGRPGELEKGGLAADRIVFE